MQIHFWRDSEAKLGAIVMGSLTVMVAMIMYTMIILEGM